MSEEAKRIYGNVAYWRTMLWVLFLHYFISAPIIGLIFFTITAPAVTLLESFVYIAIVGGWNFLVTVGYLRRLNYAEWEAKMYAEEQVRQTLDI